MFRILITTGPQKRGVFRSFTKAAEPVCCASEDAAERGVKMNWYKTNYPQLKLKYAKAGIKL